MSVYPWCKYELDTCRGNFCMLTPLGPFDINFDINCLVLAEQYKIFLLHLLPIIFLIWIKFKKIESHKWFYKFDIT